MSLQERKEHCLQTKSSFIQNNITKYNTSVEFAKQIAVKRSPKINILEATIFQLENN
jgi:hypothetical protein